MTEYFSFDCQTVVSEDMDLLQIWKVTISKG